MSVGGRGATTENDIIKGVMTTTTLDDIILCITTTRYCSVFNSNVFSAYTIILIVFSKIKTTLTPYSSQFVCVYIIRVLVYYTATTWCSSFYEKWHVFIRGRLALRATSSTEMVFQSISYHPTIGIVDQLYNIMCRYILLCGYKNISSKD